MAEIIVQIDDESIESLLSDMNLADLIENRTSSGHSGFAEFLVKKFDGIKVEVFADEHPPPHFRVKTSAGVGNFSIDTCEPLHGADAVMRRHREIRRWHKENRQMLIDRWNETRPSDCPVGQFRSEK
jgi:hypothetical protein